MFLQSLAIDLKNSNRNNGQAFNFGPSFDKDYTVQNVLIELKKKLLNLEWNIQKTDKFKESTLLKLDCKKALKYLNWKSTMDFSQTVNLTSEWYLGYLRNNNNLKELSVNQIINFSELAKNKKIKWALK